MTDVIDADLSAYCKAYRVGELRRFRSLKDESVAERGISDLGDDEIVFIHPNYHVTRSIFLPRMKEGAPSASWIQFCKDELRFAIPSDIARAMSDSEA